MSWRICLRWERLLLKFKWWLKKKKEATRVGKYTLKELHSITKELLSRCSVPLPSRRTGSLPGCSSHAVLSSGDCEDACMPRPILGNETGTLLSSTATSRPLFLNPRIKILWVCLPCYSATQSFPPPPLHHQLVMTWTSSTLSKGRLATGSHGHHLLCHCSWIIPTLHTWMRCPSNTSSPNPSSRVSYSILWGGPFITSWDFT